MGQLQSQSHSPLPSGHSHLQEHFIPPEGSCPGPGPTGAGPDPDPFPGGLVPDPFPGGLVPDPFPGGSVPDPFPGGSVPDPFPGGLVPDPFPGGVVPDPSPGVSPPGVVPAGVAEVGGAVVVGAAVVTGLTMPFMNATFPLATFMSKVKIPLAPSKETFFATPEHFLSQAPFDLGLSLEPAAIRLKVHVQVDLPTRIFSFLNTSANAEVDTTSIMAATLISIINE